MFRKTLMTTAAVAAVAAAGPAPGLAQEFTLRFAHILTTDTPAHLAAEAMAEMVAERTDGRVEIQIFPAGQLGNDTEIIEQIQLGSIDMGIPPTAKLGNFEPRVQLFDLPYIFPTPEAAYAVLDGEVGGELLASLSDQGLYGAAYWESGFKQITNNVHVIDGPEDLSGIKMRTMDSPLIIQQYEAWGANPIPLPFAEVYNALQQGVADAQENSFVSIANMKFYEVQDYLTHSNHAYLAYAFIVNQDSWETLPDDLQAAVQSAIEDARDVNRTLTAELDAELKAEIAASGVAITELDEAGLAAFVEASRAVHEDYVDVIGEDLLGRTYAVTEQYM